MKMNLLGKGIDTDVSAMDMKAKLSTLWIFILLNIIFADLHRLFQPGFLEEIMTGTVNGTQLTEGLLLLAAIMMEIPIAMVLLSRVLKYRLNRWANIIAAGPIGIAFVANSRPAAPDQIFFATIEIVTMLLIVWYAWQWANPEISPKNKI